jgi:uncharacterized membrane protein YphA (DoxX/SURF4 family)
MRAIFLLGRLAFGGYFLYNAVNHFQQRKSLAQYAGSKKVPMPEAAVIASGALMGVGGGSILSGILPKYGSLAILVFLAGVSPVMHDFWRAEDPNQRMADTINFTKNMALLGAALVMMAVDEPWPASVPIAQPRITDSVRARLAA